MNELPSFDYLLGSDDAEHERLIRQARHFAPFTERFFREAGIGPGQRVLDLGSGVGDVTMLVGKLVGPSGEVVGIERDERSLALARARAKEARQRNVSFLRSDVTQISTNRPFDAVVGRFILQFLPHPVGVLRSAVQLLNPGGIVAFQEPSFAAFVHLCPHLPLWSAGAALIHETGRRAGVHLEMGFALHKMFQEAGLPPPKMHLDVPLGSDPDFTRWVYDVIRTLVPRMQELNVSAEPLGDLATLRERLHQEIVSANAVVPVLPLVGAWTHTSAT
ncbi:MAG TPA: class I SAM-dependent methyltransferase [Candidatus Udaeobacter sp.]|jgi:ubiquinone/menaquinone biosynthesis C-methylase UbiE|nr:class I SAM-dependent methyltransferase [Candidatus Udaeobacter sp.]